ncbi:MAG: site-specific DNA-methyltransferase [Alphaproteobacteria bacterium]|nr:site-specific DNA-methyltransferase [Alphaproteobacteria bacterium]
MHMKARKEVIGSCTLYHGDCLDILPRIESVDSVITDPPYGDGTGVGYGLYDKEIAGNDDPLLNCHALRLLYHCLRKNGTIYNFTNWKHQDFLRSYAARYTRLNFKRTVIWDKKGMKLGSDFRPQHEIILVLEKGKPVYRRKDFADVQTFATVQHTADTHPHEKPLGLMKGLIAHSSQAGETILDPFMGSGSTGVAAAMMGRKFIGIELDEKYFDLACRRIEAAHKQGDFFGGNETPLEQVKMEL